jgi:hypothetical protein
MSVDDFATEAKAWIAAAKDHRWKRLYTELTYQPMQEVLTFFRAKGYRTYISSPAADRSSSACIPSACMESHLRRRHSRPPRAQCASHRLPGESLRRTRGRSFPLPRHRDAAKRKASSPPRAAFSGRAHPQAAIQLEISPCPRWAIGSNPLRSTTQIFDITRFSVSLDIPDISGACALGVQNKSRETESFGLWRSHPRAVSRRKIPFPRRVA